MTFDADISYKREAIFGPVCPNVHTRKVPHFGRAVAPSNTMKKKPFLVGEQASFGELRKFVIIFGAESYKEKQFRHSCIARICILGRHRSLVVGGTILSSSGE